MTVPAVVILPTTEDAKHFREMVIRVARALEAADKLTLAVSSIGENDPYLDQKVEKAVSEFANKFVDIYSMGHEQALSDIRTLTSIKTHSGPVGVN